MRRWLDGARGMRDAGKRALKVVTAMSLEATGGRQALSGLRRRRTPAPRVLVFAWHRVVERFDHYARAMDPGLATSARALDGQLAFLSRRYRFATMAEALEALAGRRRDGDELCVLTFDDGYADFLSHAVPVLHKYGAPATLYVSSGHIDTGEPFLHDRLYHLLRVAAAQRLPPDALDGEPEVVAVLAEARAGDASRALTTLLETQPRRACERLATMLEAALCESPLAALERARPLSWAELRAARAAGVSIGGHAVDHACLPNETDEEAYRQLCVCKARIEEELGEPVLDFAFPNGRYSHELVRALARAGYRSGVTTEDHPNYPGQDPFTLGRKCVNEMASRGLVSFSEAVTAFNFDDTMGAIGMFRGRVAEPGGAP